ncbi:hypothetical protein AMTRI_Chr03g147850 [Amborella trichopoda]
MLGLSYGEIFLILGATAALIGPKDLPIIARAAGRLAGRAVGHVQSARGHLQDVLQVSQASQVHKELQDTMAQLDAIRYEIRSLRIINPTPMTRSLDHTEVTLSSVQMEKSSIITEKTQEAHRSPEFSLQNNQEATMSSARLHSQATAYAMLAESPALKKRTLQVGNGDAKELTENMDGLLSVLPVSAENTGLLPKRADVPRGSDLMLEAIIEAEVARNARQFFGEQQHQLQGHTEGNPGSL